jgi:hypothetical protein
MVICPIALAVGCKKCPIFAACPVKGIIGDYKKPEPEAEAKRPPAKSASKKSAPARTSAKAPGSKPRTKKRR